MSAQFPTNDFVPRTIENIPGVTFDAGDTKRFFAEDHNVVTDEIVAIETYLKNPQAGGVGSIREVAAEELAGTIDGSNADLTSAHLPIAGTVKVFSSGVRVTDPADFVQTGLHFVFNQPLPAGAPRPIIDYKYVVT